MRIWACWYQAEPARSLAWIAEAAPPPNASVIDVGAGASFLVDRLVAAGYAHVGALDMAANALDKIKQRLGPTADRVDWFAGSGLEIVQYDAAKLQTLLGPEFSLGKEEIEMHKTPGGNDQKFQWTRFRRTR